MTTSKIAEIPNGLMLKSLIPYLEGHKGFVCGGAIRAILNDEKIKDIDIFFETEKDFNDAIELYSINWRKKYHTNGVVCFERNDIAHTVDLCCYIIGEPSNVLKVFDFSVSKACYRGGDELIHCDEYLNDIKNKTLIFDGGIPNPDKTMMRVLRYYGYGYSLTTDSLIKLLEAIRSHNGEFNLKDLKYNEN